MTKQEKLNNIAMSMGSMFRQASLRAYRSAFESEAKKISHSALRALVKARTGVGFIGSKDYNYYAIRWPDHQAIQEFDQTDKEDWWKDRRDCDNFALYWASEMSMRYGINTVGTVYVRLFNNKTDEKVGMHYANLIVCQNKDGIVTDVYVYEPLNDGFFKVESPSQAIEIGNWRYQLLNCEFA